jgi:hypothetical protein
MGQLEKLDNETLNKVKTDSNKWAAFLGSTESTFLDMFDKGLIEITGEKNGELIYGPTEAGRLAQAEYEKNNGKAKPNEKQRKAMKRYMEDRSAN